MKPELLRNIFLIIFIASTLVLVSFSGLAGLPAPVTSPTHAPGTETPEVVVGTPEPGSSSENSHEPSGSMNSSVALGSVITSITSLVGFITTTVITWRKEKRESSLADMERRKLETELEKSRLELEELRKKSKKKEVKRKADKK